MDPRELKDWLASIGKGQIIYELSERGRLYLAYNAVDGNVSEFIKGRLMGDPQLTCADLEGLLINEYADENRTRGTSKGRPSIRSKRGWSR